MKKRIVCSGDLGRCLSLLQPTRPFFCTTKDADGGDHVAPFAWLTPVSVRPFRVAFALQNARGRKHSETLANILREGEFAVNMPRRGQEHELVRASFMQDDYACKFDRTGYTREQAVCIRPTLITECPAGLECRLMRVLDDTGDHTLLLAEVVAAHYDPDLYDGNLVPKIPAMMPLVNLCEKRFDDHQEHIFLDTGTRRRITVYYDAAARIKEINTVMQPDEQV